MFCSEDAFVKLEKSKKYRKNVHQIESLDLVINNKKSKDHKNDKREVFVKRINSVIDLVAVEGRYQNLLWLLFYNLLPPIKPLEDQQT